MGIRYRNATPGTLLLLGATALLAIVSFNTPLLKSLYFLHATYSSGEYSGDLYLGTLGYCLTTGGKQTCTGPTIGYEFNPNELLGINLFNIPEAITKYLTYTFILHIVALAAAGASTIFGLLSHIGSMGVWCFPTCLASIASSISLLALILDLVVFYIAKARIDDVQGASASIGVCVWLVLAAWLIAGFGGCAFGIGNCCFGRRNRRGSGDPQMENYYANQNHRADDMRLQAMQDEQRRKKEQGLPSFQELERTPLTGDRSEDKYLYEEQPQIPGNSNLARDGSVLQGVGMGYGRRGGGSGSQGTFGPNGAYGDYDTLQHPANVARHGSIASGFTAGNAGVGAGGAGVEAPEQEGYGGYYGNQQHIYNDNYNDPYQQRPYDNQYEQGQGYDGQYDQNGQHQQYDQYNQAQQYDQNAGLYPDQKNQGYNATSPTHQYPPGGSTIPMPAPNPTSARDPRYDPYSNPGSSDSHYQDPGPRVSQAADPYGGYDDGLGGIGMAATSPNTDHSPQQHSPSTGHYDDYYNQNQNQNQQYDYSSKNGGQGGEQGIHVPQPQHLVNSNSTSNLLKSPTMDDRGFNDISPHGHSDYHTAETGYNDHDQDDMHGMGNRPPSYGQIADAGNGYTSSRNEKSGYR